jgi:hypothetical protein
MIHSTNSLGQNISIIYALDLGGVFTVQAFFASSVLTNKNRPEKLLRSYKFRGNMQLINAALFFISAVPIFWGLSIPISDSMSIPLRYTFWIIALFVQQIRRLQEYQTTKNR